MQLQALKAPASIDLEALRHTMVDRQIRTYDVTDQVVLARFLETPRERFLPVGFESLAYSDGEMKAPGGSGRILPTPQKLARLLQACEPQQHERVLDVGGATGYTSAILAPLVREVVMLESDSSSVEAAAANFKALGLDNVRVLDGPLAEGAPHAAPFDLIVVDGAIASGYEKLFDQLAEGGRMAAFVRHGRAGRAVLFEKIANDIRRRDLFEGLLPLLPEFAQSSSAMF